MKSFVMSVSILATMPTAAIAAQPSSTLINSLISVESSGNDKAIGDKGNAIGCLQLWESYVKDASWNGKSFSSNDRYDRQKSIEIFKSYMDRYATDSRVSQIKREIAKLEKRDISAISDDEVICRMHNGGVGFCYQTPKEKKRGDFSGRDRRIANTAYYWKKVCNS